MKASDRENLKRGAMECWESHGKNTFCDQYGCGTVLDLLSDLRAEEARSEMYHDIVISVAEALGLPKESSLSDLGEKVKTLRSGYGWTRVEDVQFTEGLDGEWTCSGCGRDWVCDAENPEANGYLFCPGCGGKITRYVPFEVAEEDAREPLPPAPEEPNLTTIRAMRDAEAGNVTEVATVDEFFRKLEE